MPGTYANPFRRLVAYGIDMTLLYTVLLGLQFGFTALTNGAVASWLVLRNNSFITYGWIFFTTSIFMWLYFITSESSLRQATWGKTIMRLKVTDTAGHRLTVGRATWRTVAKLAFFEIGHLAFLFPTPLFYEPNPPFRLGFAVVIALMVLYFVLTLISPRRQSLHDLVAQTLVVQRERAV